MLPIQRAVKFIKTQPFVRSRNVHFIQYFTSRYYHLNGFKPHPARLTPVKKCDLNCKFISADTVMFLGSLVVAVRLNIIFFVRFLLLLLRPSGSRSRIMLRCASTKRNVWLPKQRGTVKKVLTSPTSVRPSPFLHANRKTPLAYIYVSSDSEPSRFFF